MSASESETPVVDEAATDAVGPPGAGDPDVAPEEPPLDPSLSFIENDRKVTQFHYDDGGVPLYIGITWVVFIVAYLVWTFGLVIPEFLEWMKG